MEEKRIFELTEEHIILLSHTYILWMDCEFGAPGIDCKRPYGNSDVYADMAKILGIEAMETSDGEMVYTALQGRHMDKLHKELEAALQIILSTKSFVLGLYESDKYSDDWCLVGG